MKKFEYSWYRVWNLEAEALNNMCADLNDMGKDGWEAIPVDKGVFLLKREY